MLEFVYIIRPNRDNFVETMTAEEQEIMGRHFVYLQKLMGKRLVQWRMIRMTVEDKTIQGFWNPLTELRRF